MQDLQTGSMIPLKDTSQWARDAAMPDRSRQGVVLTVGEILDIKGGRFRVNSFGKKMIVLEGMPGTRAATGGEVPHDNN